jgi:hypothetical protein
MAAPRSPVLASGQHTNVTAEKSVFKYLLTGEDEPERPKGASDLEKKVGKGKIELLEHYSKPFPGQNGCNLRL